MLTAQQTMQAAQAASTVTVPTGLAPTKVIPASYRTVGFTFAREVTDDVTKQHAEVAVQLAPRNDDGVLLENQAQAPIIVSGPEGYNMCGFLMFGLKVDAAHPMVKDVQTVTGVDISDLPFTEAAPVLLVYFNAKKQMRLAEAAAAAQAQNQG